MGKSNKNIISINNLIPINLQKIEHKNVQTVNAKDVYMFLEVKKNFSDWIQQNIIRYEFIEGMDYIYYSDQGSKEYYVSLDMAKELAMVQNNPKGKQARQYFIQCEAILKKLSAQQARLDWKSARIQSILPQKQKTDTIKKFREYAEAQGSKSAHTYFENIQKMEYNALFEGGYKHLNLLSKQFPESKTLKDLLNINQLITLINADRIAEKALIEGMDLGMDYHDIYKLAKKRVEDFAALIGKDSILPETPHPCLTQ